MSVQTQSAGMSITDYLNKAIHLKNAVKYAECADVLHELLTLHPTCAHGHYEMSLALRYQGKQNASLVHAKKGAIFEPGLHLFWLNYAMQLAACGKSNEAISVLDDHSPKSCAEMDEVRACVQFCQFLDSYPRRLSHLALSNLAARGRFLSEAAVERVLWDAIERRRPHALIRLGDGEGAWTFMSNADEAKYPDLYRASRISFLVDWFGKADLIHNDGFLQFSRDVQTAIDESDIIGITDIPRIDHEYRLVSSRGVSSSVNVLRKANILDEQYDENKMFCSNNVHHGLNATGFFKRLFDRKPNVLLITSHPTLADKLASQGVTITRHFTTPGDSRNFWYESGSAVPLCQFPDVFNHVATELRSMDLGGVVALVAAGFVGKQYMAIIRRQGGVAIDLGGVADRWMSA